ncbi:right-handed parallel beta-helix repeat-containing protein, partial [Candidatus Pacearchaeota archaeon]|nr:right-handed parallel beta-helix repeat-containing protein [Candidatus Pacearchaeota archaeon]
MVEEEHTNGAVAQTNSLFVATNGSDDDPGTINEPWKTLNYALPRLKPGDTLYIRAGVYTTNLVLNEDNSGEPENPITVTAFQEEDITLDNSAIRFFGANWWVLNGLKFNNVMRHGISIGEGGSSSNQGRVTLSHHITVRNCEFTNGNREGIAIHNGDDILVDNCYFFNLRSGVADMDLVGIDVYYLGHRITIQNSRFHNIGSDGVHIGTFWYKDGANITDISILNNEFWVDRPYSGPFGNVGENGVDIKGTPGPVLISGNIFHGFRGSIDGQDC